MRRKSYNILRKRQVLGILSEKFLLPPTAGQTGISASNISRWRNQKRKFAGAKMRGHVSTCLTCLRLKFPFVQRLAATKIFPKGYQELVSFEEYCRISAAFSVILWKLNKVSGTEIDSKSWILDDTLNTLRCLLKLFHRNCQSRSLIPHTHSLSLMASLISFHVSNITHITRSTSITHITHHLPYPHCTHQLHNAW